MTPGSSFGGDEGLLIRLPIVQIIVEKFYEKRFTKMKVMLGIECCSDDKEL